MIFHSCKSEPITVNVGGRPQSVRQNIISHKLNTEKDVETLQESLAKGVDILMNFEVDGTPFVILRKYEPVKIDLAKVNLGKK